VVRIREETNKGKWGQAYKKKQRGGGKSFKPDCLQSLVINATEPDLQVSRVDQSGVQAAKKERNKGGARGENFSESWKSIGSKKNGDKSEK